jgi:hypothetical protein
MKVTRGTLHEMIDKVNESELHEIYEFHFQKYLLRSVGYIRDTAEIRVKTGHTLTFISNLRPIGFYIGIFSSIG